MSERENVQGDGFEILGHEAPAPEPGEAQASTQPEAEEAAPFGEPGTEGGPEAALAKPDIYAILQVFLRELERLAWWNLGLDTNPFTGAVERDIEQARVTIDAVSALADLLLPHLEGQQARELRTLVTNLRLNYVKQAEQG
jgi:hypothetical protein